MGRTLMVAREGSGQSLLMYTNAFWLFAHTAPLSKSCPAVRLAAVSRASGGPAGWRHSSGSAAASAAEPKNWERQGSAPLANTASQTAALPSTAAAHSGTPKLFRPSSLSRLLMQASWMYSLEMLQWGAHRSEAWHLQGLHAIQGKC